MTILEKRNIMVQFYTMSNLHGGVTYINSLTDTEIFFEWLEYSTTI